MLKILHTADWHLGQTFHEYERLDEHQAFLNWMTELVQREKVDVMLICGDIFDHANPNIRSTKMWYRFLRDVTSKNPELQIIIIAGNHDSATRLESPQPLLDDTRIRIIGSVKRDENGVIPMEQFIVPIYNSQKEIAAYCLAIPFLRLGDFPNIEGESLSYSEGVTKMYQLAHDYAAENLQTDIPLIAMGHLHAQHAEISDEDKYEREIMGGVQNIPSSAFHPDIQYVALGHIHKAQKIGGQEHIRYSGSPIPMSFSEINYKHQVLTFEIEDQKVQHIQSIEVPVHTELIRVPKKHLPLEDALKELDLLPVKNSVYTPPPYLEVRILLQQPEPSLKYRIEAALQSKHVRLARIDILRPKKEQDASETIVLKELHQLRPEDVFRRIYEQKFNNAPSEQMMQLFHQSCTEATSNESL